MRAFELPDNNANFDCPHGVAWLGESPAPIHADAPMVRKPCAGCGGEKFDPPNTPADIEQLLREQVNP